MIPTPAQRMTEPAEEVRERLLRVLSAATSSSSSRRSRWHRSSLGCLRRSALVPDVPLVLAVLAVTVLSLGYDMTQRLLAGIVTALGGRRGGQAMGLNVFALFIGFGLGSLLFGEALRLDFGPALAIFASLEVTAALVAIPLFGGETRSPERGREGSESLG